MMTPVRGLPTPAVPDLLSTTRADASRLAVARQVTLCRDGLVLESGAVLRPVVVSYEAYGQLSPARDNVILICHALSGSAHAAGSAIGGQKAGWWDEMIGPGKPFDTDRYYVICSNVLGSCYGTTGPSSINPATGRPFAMAFPVITIGDMVEVQRHLLDSLGIDQLAAVAGGSMGGMQALQWAVKYPERVRRVIAIATTHQHSPQQIAFNEVARQAVIADPEWNNGNYYGKDCPRLGLAVARMIGHVTYLSDAGMRAKFGRRLQHRSYFAYDFETDFEVESYLRHQGRSFVERFDANSLLYITKALDYFDLGAGVEQLREAFAGVEARFLLLTFSSDWLYPAYQLGEVALAVCEAGGIAEYHELQSDYGHDAFLVEHEVQAPIIRRFLAEK